MSRRIADTVGNPGRDEARTLVVWRPMRPSLRALPGHSLTTTGQPVTGARSSRVRDRADGRYDLGKPCGAARSTTAGSACATDGVRPAASGGAVVAEGSRDLRDVAIGRSRLRSVAWRRAHRPAYAVIAIRPRAADILRDTLDASTQFVARPREDADGRAGTKSSVNGSASVAMVNCTASNTTSSDTVTDTSAARVV